MLGLGVSLPALVTPGGGLPWRLLRTLIYNLPAGSKLYESMGLSNAWTTEAHLIAHAVDALAAANWQRSKDGQRGTNRPKPVKRPGSAPAKNVRKYGKATRSPEEVMAHLKRIGPQREEAASD